MARITSVKNGEITVEGNLGELFSSLTVNDVIKLSAFKEWLDERSMCQYPPLVFQHSPCSRTIPFPEDMAPKCNPHCALTQEEIQNYIGFKVLRFLSTADRRDLLGVYSPAFDSPWYQDDRGWYLRADRIPEETHSHGIYISFDYHEAERYQSTTLYDENGRHHSWRVCKVALSGQIVECERGARGEFARLLEIMDVEGDFE